MKMQTPTEDNNSDDDDDNKPSGGSGGNKTTASEIVPDSHLENVLEKTEFWNGEVIQVKSLYESGNKITTLFDDGTKSTVLLTPDGIIQPYNNTNQNPIFVPVNPSVPTIPSFSPMPIPVMP